MNEMRTTAILQRVPVILAVTAHSYGLSLQAAGSRKPAACDERRRHAGNRTGAKPAAQQ